jgi:hypothetical protein
MTHRKGIADNDLMGSVRKFMLLMQRSMISLVSLLSSLLVPPLRSLRTSQETEIFLS